MSRIIKSLAEAAVLLESSGRTKEARQVDMVLKKISSEARSFAIELRMKAHVPAKYMEGIDEPPVASHKKVDWELVVLPVENGTAKSQPIHEDKGSFNGNANDLVKSLQDEVTILKGQFSPASFVTKVEFIGI